MNLEALTAAIRFGLYLDLMLLFGGAALGLHARLATPAEPNGGSTGMVFTALAGLLVSALGLVTLAASMSGTALWAVDSTAISLLLTQTSVGTAGIVRLLGLLAALGFCLIWRNRPLLSAAGVTVAGGIALASLAWSGHGAMDGWLHLGGDIVHLLAAGIWVGALAGLLRLALHRAPANLAHLRRLHAALERFSAIGVAVVLLALLSGLVNVWFLVGNAPLRDIIASTWSQLLAAKLILFVAMLTLAAVNRFRLTPALTGPHKDEAQRRLRLSLSVETTAAVLILLLIAWLGLLEPPVSGL